MINDFLIFSSFFFDFTTINMSDVSKTPSKLDASYPPWTRTAITAKTEAVDDGQYRELNLTLSQTVDLLLLQYHCILSLLLLLLFLLFL